MADHEMKVCREGYGQALLELGEINRDIVVLDADLSGSTKTSVFNAKFPERFFDIGIAEANMMGIAAGLATCGKTVFASTFAVFATGRVFDQIRQSIAYPNLNVKIVATHAGITVGGDGASHQINEDLSITRVIPNMTIMAPADYYETILAVKAAVEYNGPVYIRMGRSAVPVIYDESYDFRFGKSSLLRDGTDVAVIAMGAMVARSLDAADILNREGIGVRVINMSTIKPLDQEAVIKAARECGCVVTVEEHSIFGGLGTAVAEVIATRYPVPQQILGIPDTFGESGGSEELLVAYGLTVEAIVGHCHRAIERKGI